MIAASVTLCSPFELTVESNLACRTVEKAANRAPLLVCNKKLPQAPR
jgi:hypothetical protein